MSRLKTPDPDLTLIGNTWRHFAFGEPLMAPVDGFQITRDRFDQALVRYLPIARALDEVGYTHDEAWAYLADAAPWAVDLVGVQRDNALGVDNCN